MTLDPFPEVSRMRWRRLDVPGREDARVDRTATGWRLAGELDVTESGVAARLRYVIECAPDWHTRVATIEGDVNGDPVRFALAADGEGRWTADGASAPVRSAWLRFPDLRLETLEQTYTREAAERFRYRAVVDGDPFTARLDTDAFGRVHRYEGLWEAEFATSSYNRAGR